MNALAACCSDVDNTPVISLFSLAVSSISAPNLWNRSIYKLVDSKGLYGRWRLHLMAFSGKMKSLENAILCTLSHALGFAHPLGNFHPSLLTKPLVTRMTSLAKKRACQQNTNMAAKKDGYVNESAEKVVQINNQNLKGPERDLQAIFMKLRVDNGP